jgi:hypothetical protein
MGKILVEDQNLKYQEEPEHLVEERNPIASGKRKPVLKQEMAETIRNVLDGKQKVEARYSLALNSRTTEPGGMDLMQ